jgi:hypothetical protein
VRSRQRGLRRRSGGYGHGIVDLRLVEVEPSRVWWRRGFQRSQGFLRVVRLWGSTGREVVLGCGHARGLVYGKLWKVIWAGGRGRLRTLRAVVCVRERDRLADILLWCMVPSELMPEQSRCAYQRGRRGASDLAFFL